MKQLYYTKVALDIFDNYILKEISKSIYGGGNKCHVALYNDVIKCINARKELYETVWYNSVEEFLLYYKYPKEFVEKFLLKVEEDPKNSESCPGY